MAKPALRRRRGTKSRSRQHAQLTTVLAGFLLVGIGLAVGLIVGFLFYSSNPAVHNKIDAGKAQVSKLRGKAAEHLGFNPSKEALNLKDNPRAAKLVEQWETTHHLGHSPKKNGQGTGGGGSKLDFLNHKPEIGTSGAFPYYPKDSTVSEHHDFSNFEAPGGYRFEEYKWGDSPYKYSKGESDTLARSRRFHVKKAMQHAWSNYEKYAFGDDEIKPMSLSSSSNWGHLGITLVDSLDTLWLMDMKEEFNRARDWCRDVLDHNQNSDVSVFETTIRSLGGLLSAYDWSQDQTFLDQAKDLGARLFKSYDSESGIPYGRVNLQKGDTSNLGWSPSDGILAEFGTQQLEFRVLSKVSGNKEYKRKTEKVFQVMRDMKPDHALYPYFIYNRGSKPKFSNDKLTFGAMSDSFYEYMLKIWLQGGKTEQMYRDMYDESMQGMFDELFSVSSPSGLAFIADKENGRMDTKQDHLVCFMGGLLALGAYTDPLGLESERAQRDLKTAKAITYTCYQTYARMASGISPEFVQFYEGQDFEAGRGGHHYLLRPETVESLFVLYHLTGDPVYREWGWEIFQAIEKHCRVKGGYGGIRDVRKPNPLTEDKMESFFLAETIKYLYLLFDPDTPIDLLNKHVFNTEAHPMRIFPEMDKNGGGGLLSMFK